MRTSHYVIEAGIARNCCAGSDTRVACQGWTVHCGAKEPGSYPRGEHPFWDPTFSEENSLETKNPLWEFRVSMVSKTNIDFFFLMS